MDLDTKISSFIQNILRGEKTAELNLFFSQSMQKLASSRSSPELFILYKKLSQEIYKGKLLKLMLTLKNYLIINDIHKIPRLAPGSFCNKGQKIRVKLKKISDSSADHYFAELRNLESFGFTESGDLSQTSQVKLMILNYYGLVYFNLDSGVLIEFKSVEVRLGYEIYFTGLGYGEDCFVVEVTDLGDDFICLASYKNSYKFCEDYKDLRRAFDEIQFDVDLLRKGNSWVVICKNHFKPFFMLRKNNDRSWVFIHSGLNFVFENTKYSIKYSYTN